MKRIERGRFMACLVIAVLVIVGGAFAASASDLRRIVVFVKGTSSQVQLQVIERSGSKALKVLSLINGVAIELPAQGTAQALSTLKAEPTVERVYDDPTIAVQGVVPISAEGIDVYIQPASAPAHESYSWGLERIGIPDVHEAWPALDGSGVKVAILDTGIDKKHQDLKPISGCVDVRAVEQSQIDCQDDNGHGTHMAGIIAARVNQTAGLLGAAPNVYIYSIRVLDAHGAGKASDLLSGLQWISDYNSNTDSGIKLVNMSLGFPQEWGPYPYLETAIESLSNTGVIMVAAAGNRNPRSGAEGAGADGAGADGAGADGTCPGGSTPPPDEGGSAQGAGADGEGSTYCYLTTQVKVPAAYPWVVAVGAIDKKARVADYSRWGREMQEHGVVAPGGSTNRNTQGVFTEGILSTNIKKSYGLGVGTSQAAAHVTGTLALVQQLQPNISLSDILHFLQRTSSSAHDLRCEDDEGHPVPRSYCEGAGIIDAEDLVDLLKK